MVTNAEIVEIAIYPVKSCRPVRIETAEIARTGLGGDRVWQVSADGAPLTQRQCRVLATVQPTPISGGLRLSAAGQDDIEVPTPDVADTRTGSLTGTSVDVADAGDEAAAWFSAVTGIQCRLHHMTDESDLRAPPTIDLFGQAISFADLAPIHLLNTSSYDYLAGRSAEAFPIDRFRSNIVVDTPEPWVEDRWRTFTIGPVELRSHLPWPRCAMPQCDQLSSERKREPANVLKAHRWCDSAPTLDGAVRKLIEGNALFGIGCSATPIGSTISVGDKVEVTETAAPILAPPP